LPAIRSWSNQLGRTMMIAVVLICGLQRVAAQNVFDLDIRSQPLSRALHAFSVATGIEVMVDARHVAGREAPEVRGSMPPLVAVSMLLAGSNLVVHQFAPGTLAIDEPLAANAASPEDQQYYADIQRAVERALCSDPRTLPGRYRLALKIWVGRTGEVIRSKRLDTTGDRSRDYLLDAMIPALSIAKAPPQRFPQTIALVVSPSAAGSAEACAPGWPAPRRAANP
jgi:hypothetical protein